MKNELENIYKRAVEDFSKSKVFDDIENFRVKYLGKKGELTSILKQMGKLSNEERPEIGKIANKIRCDIEKKINNRLEDIKKDMLCKRLTNEKIDVTLPGKKHILGHIHPLTQVQKEIEEIFIGMGFTIVEGPEVEYDKYNFEALNIPKDHPARDEQDTFYINDNIVLRTQTSPVQVRTMETHKPPIKIISPGRVYRSDAIDATHYPIFHQIEGLVVDKGVTFANLKWTLETFIKKLYGDSTVIRFRPHHFQFTEPSAEVDMQCFHCNGKGCSLCKNEGFIEMLGCGMVHPKVLSRCGIDKDEYSGFAFGLGLERVTMRKYEINDLRLFYENDIRFLNQF